MSDPLDTPATEPAAPRLDLGAFQLRGDPPRVMRLSRKALTVVGVAAGLGIGGSLIYARLFDPTRFGLATRRRVPPGHHAERAKC